MSDWLLSYFDVGKANMFRLIGCCHITIYFHMSDWLLSCLPLYKLEMTRTWLSACGRVTVK